MTDTPTFEELRAAWLAYPPSPANGDDLIRMLVTRFHAYEISTSVIPNHDYEMDGDVHADDVWRLFTIDDQIIIDSLKDDDERESALFHRSQPEPWREIYGNIEGVVEANPESAHTLLNMQQARGERLTILLESSDGSTVDGFKVYGLADRFVSILIGHIGWQKYAEGPSNPHGVPLGDIANEDFQRYLTAAWDEGLLVGSEPSS